MADEDKHVDNIEDNDEYQFADLDGLGTESLDPVLDVDEVEVNTASEGASSPPERGRLDPHMMKIIKNGVLAVGGLILFLFIYKLIISFFTTTPEVTPKNRPVAVKKAPAPALITTKEPMMPVQIAHETLNNNTDKKINALEKERERLNADLLLMHKQIRDVTQTVSNMATSLQDIKQGMEQINEKMEQQSQQMVRLQTMNHRKHVASVPKEKKVRPPVERTQYFIQAIIPGRAWLMSTKGTTLTVSRGSAVPGYGDVRLINPKLGRIFTSSGRVIQFSEVDS